MYRSRPGGMGIIRYRGMGQTAVPILTPDQAMTGLKFFPWLILGLAGFFLMQRR